MSITDVVYFKNAQEVLTHGRFSNDRTQTGMIARTGTSARYENVGENFPLLTTKRVPFKLVLSELLWFLTGNTNIRPLLQVKCHIWSEWPWKKYVDKTGHKISIQEFESKILEDEQFAQEYGDLGPVYGKQWRDCNGIDQFANVIEALRNNPTDRGHIISGWHVPDLGQMALRPCHTLYQFFPTGNKLDLIMYQRSGDMFLGVPFNIASCAILIHMVAKLTGYEPGDLIHDQGVSHFYTNHLDQITQQMQNSPYRYQCPKLKIHGDQKSIDCFKLDDFELTGYQSYPTIKGDVAI